MTVHLEDSLSEEARSLRECDCCSGAASAAAALIV